MKRILIVEDESALRDVYKTLFKLEKYSVHEAANGREALKQLPKTKPDVILLDILMPVMGGVEFLKTAKLSQEYPSTKVLVLSNLSDPKTLKDITSLGVHKYLLKASASPVELVGAVHELLG